MAICIVIASGCASAGAPNMKAPKPISNVGNGDVGKITLSGSYNWAGYAVTGSDGSVSNVKGSWIVPKVQTTTKNQYSCNWIGIDGYNSATVEQLGTDSNTDSKGRAVYYAWYEFYPDYAYYIPDMPITPGDNIYTEVSYSADTNKMKLSMTNQNTGKSWSMEHDATGYARSSAEWVTEAPSMGNRILPLTNFGTTFFGSYYTPTITGTGVATIGGNTNTIGGFDADTDATTNAYSVAMVSQARKNPIKAQPSALTNGDSFSVKWLRAS